MATRIEPTRSRAYAAPLSLLLAAGCGAERPGVAPPPAQGVAASPAGDSPRAKGGVVPEKLAPASLRLR